MAGQCSKSHGEHLDHTICPNKTPSLLSAEFWEWDEQFEYKYLTKLEWILNISIRLSWVVRFIAIKFDCVQLEGGFCVVSFFYFFVAWSIVCVDEFDSVLDCCFNDDSGYIIISSAKKSATL